MIGGILCLKGQGGFNKRASFRATAHHSAQYDTRCPPAPHVAWQPLFVAILWFSHPFVQHKRIFITCGALRVIKLPRFIIQSKSIALLMSSFVLDLDFGTVDGNQFGIFLF